jgi:hypothetical protein
VYPSAYRVVLVPEVGALFPRSFEQSPLGDVPKGWQVVPIGEVVKVVGGSTPRTGACLP